MIVSDLMYCKLCAYMIFSVSHVDQGDCEDALIQRNNASFTVRKNQIREIRKQVTS